jgi:hypothetical protein
LAGTTHQPHLPYLYITELRPGASSPRTSIRKIIIFTTINQFHQFWSLYGVSRPLSFSIGTSGAFHAPASVILQHFGGWDGTLLARVVSFKGWEAICPSSFVIVKGMSR